MHAPVLNPRNSSQANALFASVWPSSNLHHQICSYDRANHTFNNIPVTGFTEATRLTTAVSKQGNEAYFACAEFITTNNREASNAAGASCLFFDIDCGKNKALAGIGYETEIAAVKELEQFCQDTGIPYATHIVFSGSGLHVYWAFDSFVERATWQTYAKKLKALSRARVFLVDHSRTADIASVLRVPGTLNYKYSPPRLVTLEYKAEEPINHLAMFASIDAAYNKFCSYSLTSVPNNAIQVDFTGTRFQKFGPPNLDSLASALAMLEPDCDERTWKLYRIAPMARAARDHGDYGVALFELAKSWSSGELQGKQSKAWFTCTGNGKRGKDVFDAVWYRFLNEKPTDQLVTTLGSIYRDAKEVGWLGWDEDSFQVVANEGGQ
ncbi:MAG: hypothetical protein V4570_00015 [Pseudomonadota bacterium]